MGKVEIAEYKWAGKWGPFKVKTHCKECYITWATLKSMMDKEFKNKPVKIAMKPWLNNWLYCLLREAYHPPIIMVDGKKFHQFSEKEPIF